MPTVQNTAPRSNTRGDSLADILERVLDTGIVIAGDIRVQLADIELLTIQIRLIICSVDKAQQLGMDWWKGASFLQADPIPQGAPTPPATAPNAAGQSAQQLGWNEPATVSTMQEQFGATASEPRQPVPERAQAPAPARPTSSSDPTPAWQVPSTPQQPWDEPTKAEAAQPQPEPARQPEPAQPAQPAQPVQPAQQQAQPAPPNAPSTDLSAVQVEMLNERLARLETVLERLLPPEE